MRILYLTQWFHPEPNIVKGSAFVRALEEAGHEVTVVTALPNYPAGRIYPGYKLRPIQTELLDGVRVVRLPIYANHGSSAIGRSLNFLSFFVAVLLYCLVRRRSYDAAYVYHPPITVGLAAALAGLFRPLPMVLDVQDLWPDTIAAAGMRGCRTLALLLGPICGFVYRRSSAVVAQSAGMRRALIERGVPADKVTTIGNWADVGEVKPPPAAGSDRSRPFTIIYAGNLGRAQALHTLVDAAGIVERTRGDVRILVYGDGVDSARLRARAKAAGVGNLSIEDARPKDEIVGILAGADALLIHLADQRLFEVTIPSKCQFYLALGRPIVAGVAGEAAELLNQSGSALVVEPCNPGALAAAFTAMADLPAAERERMASSGRRFYEENFAFERGVGRILSLIEGLSPAHAAAGLAAAT
jgi:glycosyltransferase involved in cell wall biosynthesis